MRQSYKGFTLIELMTTVAIIAILAAIAIPSYRQYIKRNAESQTQAKMKQLQIELERWRSNALTYKGFVPQKITGNTTVNAYDASGKYIYVPDATNTRYTISILDGNSSVGNEVALTGTDSATTVDNATGRNWIIFAIPNSDLERMGASRILLTSSGLQCKNPSSSFTFAATCSESGSVKW